MSTFYKMISGVKIEAAYDAAFESVLANEFGPEAVTEGFGEKVKNALDKVIDAIKKFVEKVVKFLKSIGNWISRHWNAFVAKFKGNEEVEVADPDKLKKADELNQKAAEAIAKDDKEGYKSLIEQRDEMVKSAYENKVVLKAPEEFKKRLESNIISADQMGKTVEIIKKEVRQVPNKETKVQPWKKQEPQHGARDKETGNWKWDACKNVGKYISYAERMKAAEINRLIMPKAKAADPAIEEDPAVKQLAVALSADHDMMVA